MNDENEKCQYCEKDYEKENAFYSKAGREFCTEKCYVDRKLYELQHCSF